MKIVSYKFCGKDGPEVRIPGTPLFEVRGWDTNPLMALVASSEPDTHLFILNKHGVVKPSFVWPTTAVDFDRWVFRLDSEGWGAPMTGDEVGGHTVTLRGKVEKYLARYPDRKFIMADRLMQMLDKGPSPV